jgi:hypothetical protein
MQDPEEIKKFYEDLAKNEESTMTEMGIIQGLKRPT